MKKNLSLLLVVLLTLSMVTGCTTETIPEKVDKIEVNKLVEGAKSVTDTVVDTAKEIAENEDVQKVVTTVKTETSEIVEKVAESDIIDKVVDVATDEKVTDKLDELKEGAVDVITHTVNSVKEEDKKGTSTSNESGTIKETSKAGEYGVISTQGFTYDLDELMRSHKMIEVYGGDLSGDREANVVVDVGFGEREYLSFTNDDEQVYLIYAPVIKLQDEANEELLGGNRYYKDEAKVAGTESGYTNSKGEYREYDEGHGISDQLGGVANSYNITPQESHINRYGDQRYEEKNIAEAIYEGKKVTDFIYVITYPNKNTMIPDHYYVSYRIDGRLVEKSFPNLNPDDVNEPMIRQQKQEDTEKETNQTSTTNKSVTPNSIVEGDISKIDTNNNGHVSIAEAKNAGFKMPIYDTHWLYQYMTDGNNNGMVGE